MAILLVVFSDISQEATFGVFEEYLERSHEEYEE